MLFQTKTIEDTELVYSLLREKYPDRQIEIEYNDNTKEYILKITSEEYKEDPTVPLDIRVKCIYGDSITGDTPLLLQKDGKIYIETIQSIFDVNKKVEYPGLKIFDKTIRLEKEYSLTDYKIWTDIGWTCIKKVIRHKCDKKIYRVLTHTGCVDVTEDHSLIRENGEKVKPGELKVGDSLLHSFPKEFDNSFKVKLSGNNSERAYDYFKLSGVLYCICDSKIEAAINYYIFSSMCKVNIKLIKLTSSAKYLLSNSACEFYNKITNIIEKGQINDYVYDIETDIGRFQAGVGDLIVKNTDSVFLSIKFNRNDFVKNRLDTFKMATICGDNITEMFNREPIVLEFEKVFQPFILLTKKRYIGKKYEDMRDPLKLKAITNSGTAVTRRDFCKMVKDCYKDVIDCIVDDNGSVDQSIEIYKSYIDRLDAYQIDTSDLIVSKMLAKSYSCALCKEKHEWNNLKCINKSCEKTLSLPGSKKCIKCSKEFKCVHKFSLVHVQLAIRMLNRKDEANVNDRIPYIFIESKDSLLAKSDLGEDPIYAKNNGLKYNRSFYLESLAKTLLAFFKIILNENKNELDDVINYTNDKFESYGSKKLKPSDYMIED